MELQEQCKADDIELWMGWMEVSSQKYFTLFGGSALSQWKQTNSKRNSAGYLFQNCRWKIAGSKLGATTSIPSIQVTNIIFPELGERSVDAKVGDHRPVLKAKLTKMGVKQAAVTGWFP